MTIKQEFHNVGQAMKTPEFWKTFAVNFFENISGYSNIEEIRQHKDVGSNYMWAIMDIALLVVPGLDVLGLSAGYAARFAGRSVEDVRDFMPSKFVSDIAFRQNWFGVASHDTAFGINIGGISDKDREFYNDYRAYLNGQKNSSAYFSGKPNPEPDFVKSVLLSTSEPRESSYTVIRLFNKFSRNISDKFNELTGNYYLEEYPSMMGREYEEARSFANQRGILGDVDKKITEGIQSKLAGESGTGNVNKAAYDWIHSRTYTYNAALYKKAYAFQILWTDKASFSQTLVQQSPQSQGADIAVDPIGYALNN